MKISNVEKRMTSGGPETPRLNFKDLIVADAEKIEFDGKAFNTVTSDAVQNFLGTIFYIFYLKQTS